MWGPDLGLLSSRRRWPGAVFYLPAHRWPGLEGGKDPGAACLWGRRRERGDAFEGLREESTGAGLRAAGPSLPGGVRVR